MPHKVCLEPGCPSFVAPKGRGRCQRHARERDKGINRAGRKLYSTKRWKLTRRHKLNRDPMCERCGREVANTVHHRTDLADGGDPYSLDNLESCCPVCHSQETRARQVAST